MSAPATAACALGFQELDRLYRELDALAETDVRTRTALDQIARAGVELRGAVTGMLPAVRELAVQADGGIATGRCAPSGAFDSLELDRYAFVHETCRTLSDRASDLQRLQARLEGPRSMLQASSAKRAAHLRAVQEAVRHLAPADPDAVSRAVEQQVAAFAAQHGVVLAVAGGPAGMALAPATAAALGALLCAVARYTVASTLAAAGGECPALTLDVRAGHAPAALDIAIAVRGDDSGAVLAALAPGVSGHVTGGVQGRAETTGEPAAETSAEAVAPPAAETCTAAEVLRQARDAGARIVRAGPVLHLFLPLPGAEEAVLFAGAGEQVFGLLLRQLQAVVRLGDVSRDDAGALRIGDGAPVPVLDLAVLAGVAPPQQPPARRYAALLAGCETDCALLFDRIEGDARVQLLPFASPLPGDCTVSGASPGSVRGSVMGPVMGAAPFATGRTVMVLDAVALGRAAVQPPGARPAGEVPRIMVVDDSVTIRTVTERMLRRNGLAVQAARDGRDALEQVTAAAPDLILLDIEMPRMNGFQFLEALRADGGAAHVPVVMISSRSGDKHRQHALALGVTHFLGKPFAERDLMASIAELLQWRP